MSGHTTSGFLLVGSGMGIRCRDCEQTSYNRIDIAESYCGACHRFHPAAKANEGGALGVRALADGRVLILYPLLFGAAQLSVSSPESLAWGFLDDTWHYTDHAAAHKALEAWDGTGEPEGWYRHPSTGRRRPGGDPAQEFIRH